jgi:hypothetical protein
MVLGRYRKVTERQAYVTQNNNKSVVVARAGERFDAESQKCGIRIVIEAKFYV